MPLWVDFADFWIKMYFLRKFGSVRFLYFTIIYHHEKKKKPLPRITLK